MNNKGSFIINFVEHMKPGTEIVLEGYFFDEAFPLGPWGGFPGIYRTSRQMFLSNCIGSGWGRVTCERDPLTGNYNIGKHECGEKRVYIDPDREHLFERMADGSLSFIGDG